MSNGNSNNPPKVFIYKAVASSNWPVYTGEWGIELEDETEFMFYQNLASDLIAGVMVKLGQEFSKYRLDGDVGRLADEMDRVDSVLRGSMLR
jgi:hypothetical protein